MNTRCGKCGADLQIDPSMVGKRLECPACHHSFHLQAMPGTEPVAQTRRFRPFEPRPIADAQPHVVDPGGRGLPPHMRNYGRLGVCFCGLVLAALFLVPLDLTPDAQPVFCKGLYEVADVPQLKVLLEHVVYDQPGRPVPPTLYDTPTARVAR